MLQFLWLRSSPISRNEPTAAHAFAPRPPHENPGSSTLVEALTPCADRLRYAADDTASYSTMHGFADKCELAAQPIRMHRLAAQHPLVSRSWALSERLPACFAR